jgi:hypothetical protein
MADKKIFSRVKMLTTTTGTGSVSISGVALASYFNFSEVGAANNDQIYYVIDASYDDLTSGDFEIGIGTLTSISGATATLSRDTVLSSSNSNNLVDFSAGTKSVSSVLPGEATVITNLATDNAETIAIEHTMAVN